jgi:type I restriction enzyme M protein
LASADELKGIIETDAGLQEREKAVREAADEAWDELVPQLDELPDTKNLAPVRCAVLESFRTHLLPIALLDSYKIEGVAATWWKSVEYDLRALASRGYDGLVDGWVGTILDALADNESKARGDFALEMPVVSQLVGDYLRDVAAAEEDLAQAQGALASSLASDLDAEEAGDGDQEEVSPEIEKALRKAVTDAKARVKSLHRLLAERVQTKADELDEDGKRSLALVVLHHQLITVLGKYVIEHRRSIATVATSWWGKYRETYESIVAKQVAAEAALYEALRGLGYV